MTATIPGVAWLRGGTVGPATGAGAIAGLAGGVVFAAAMLSPGAVPTGGVSGHGGWAAVAFIAQLVLYTAIGAGFGVLVAAQRATVGETLLWGLSYGAFWWFLGPLTLQPLVLGRSVAWDLSAAQSLLPSLIDHLFYGATTALVFLALRRRPGGARRGMLTTAVRGVAAGVIATVLLYLVLGVMAGGAVPSWLFGIGAVAGLIYPVLFGARGKGAGPALVLGTAYGFLCWVVAGVTLPSVLRDGMLEWSHPAVAATVDRLPTYLLLGAGIAVVFTWLDSLGRWLFIDDVTMLRAASPGAWGLRATGYGALAGLAGGGVFTVVMVLVNELPTVAKIVGAHAAVAGLVVHLVIAQLIGVSYAVLFRRRSFDLASGIGWGVCYGFFWWTLGDLTLLPALTGGVPKFDAATIAAEFPSLVGHLAYGAALGALYYRLEERINPWWFARSEAEAQRVAALRDQTLGAAPALWGFTVLIALTIPIIISG
jgi:uncharacterized membrane protein YagU involved in acid resistance